MSNQVKTAPNLPPALRAQIDQHVAAISAAWHLSEGNEYSLDPRKVTEIRNDLCAAVESAWDVRDRLLQVNLKAITYHLGQLKHLADLPQSAAGDHLRGAQAALDRVVGMLEESR